MIYAGTAQSLSGLARELLASETLYQSCNSLRVVAGLQRLLSFLANSELVYYPRAQAGRVMYQAGVCIREYGSTLYVVGTCRITH